MSLSPSLLQFFWIGIILLLVVIQIASALLLKQDHAPSAWAMLAGVCLSTAISIISQLVHFLIPDPDSTFYAEWKTSLWITGFLGQVLFLAGFLINLRKQRASTERLDELERSLTSR